jgi:HlyD family secretion protein
MKKIIVVLIASALVGGSGFWYMRNGRDSTAFRTVTVERGDLIASINASGTIQPEEVINVGAQVAGQVKGFGADPRDTRRKIDYGSPVEEETVLAWIDDSVYQAQLNRAKADLLRAQADLLQLKAKERQAERDFERLKDLRARQIISDAEYDAAETAYVFAKSSRAVGEAAVAQAQAALDQAQINLGYCTIKSPVKGVIVDRRVNVGQTVVASLNSPSLFLIAKDLKRLQVWASVNEADVGHIRSGQEVSFGVDAFPGRVFRGVVAEDQPRLNASMIQNVVTYTVVVNTDNADGKLLPYMTANLQFRVDDRSNAMLVPNGALRYRPNPDDVVEEARAAVLESQSATASDRLSDPQAHDQGTLWVAEGRLLRPVPVRIGLSDGSRTEILEGDLQDGAQVVIGMLTTDEEPSTSPFVQQRFRRKQQ